MAKRKLTPEILELIELCAEDSYTLDEIREEADITKPLMDNLQVQETIERGRSKKIIEIVVEDDGDAAKDFAERVGITPTEFKLIHEKNIEVIETKKAKINAHRKERSEARLYTAGVAGANIYLQTPELDRGQLSINSLADGIADAAKALNEGDTTPLLEILIGNIQQLHLFNGTITQNLLDSKSIDNFNKLSNMQLKVMQETRKSIMAINEIANPKRTTFIKEANQHNHLHQNSEKKDECQNELQKLESFTDAEVTPVKEKHNENKLT